MEKVTKQTDTLRFDLSKTGLGEIYFQCLKKYSKKILQYVTDNNEADTYEDILKKSIRTALKLKEKGINKNDIISTCTYNHKNSLVPFLATMFLGAKSANFDQSLSHSDTIMLMKLIEPKIIFVADESLSFMETCLAESKITSELVLFGESESYSTFDEYIQPHEEEEYFKPIQIEDSRATAAIFFSSGTTGLPKGICLSHYSLLGPQTDVDILEVKDKCADEEQLVMLIFTRLSSVSSIIILTKCILEGNCRIVCRKFDPFETWKIIENYKVMFLIFTPHQATEFLAHSQNIDTSKLKLCFLGGSAVTQKLMDDLKMALPHTKIMHGYGQTETGGMTTNFDITKSEDIDLQSRKPKSCGKIRGGVTWKIVDPDTEKIVGPFQKGELRVKSKFIMNGYYKMDSSSAFDNEGFLKTGDIFYYDEDECFYVVGRLKELLTYRSWKIMPVDIEEQLLAHPAVREAVVIGIPHEIDGVHLMGVVVIDDEIKSVTQLHIEKYLEERVPEEHRLRAGVKFAKILPRTGTGKIQRNVIRTMVLNGEI